MLQLCHLVMSTLEGLTAILHKPLYIGYLPIAKHLYVLLLIHLLQAANIKKTTL